MDSDCRNPPLKLRSPGSESSGSQGCRGLRLPKYPSKTSESWVGVQSFRGLRLPKSPSKGFLGRRCECPTGTLAGSHAPRDRCFMAAAPSHHNSAGQSLGRNPSGVRDSFETMLRRDQLQPRRRWPVPRLPEQNPEARRQEGRPPRIVRVARMYI